MFRSPWLTCSSDWNRFSAPAMVLMPGKRRNFLVPTILPKCAAAWRMRSTLVSLEIRGHRLPANDLYLGLFAPRGVHQYRDEQRRLRSQYDRGTHHAELEAATEVDPRVPPMVRMPTSRPFYGSPFLSTRTSRLDGGPGSYGY